MYGSQRQQGSGSCVACVSAPPPIPPLPPQYKTPRGTRGQRAVAKKWNRDPWPCIVGRNLVSSGAWHQVCHCPQPVLVYTCERARAGMCECVCPCIDEIEHNRAIRPCRAKSFESTRGRFQLWGINDILLTRKHLTEHDNRR